MVQAFVVDADSLFLGSKNNGEVVLGLNLYGIGILPQGVLCYHVTDPDQSCHCYNQDQEDGSYQVIRERISSKNLLFHPVTPLSIGSGEWYLFDTFFWSLDGRI